MALDSFEIIGGESWSRGPAYLTSELPAGATIASGTVAAYNVGRLGEDFGALDNSVLGGTSAVVTDTTAVILLTPAVSMIGRVYKIVFTLTLSNSNVFVTQMWMSVVARA